MGVQYNLITKAGAFFKIDGQNVQGREAAKKYLMDNPKIADQLKANIWEVVRGSISTDDKKNEEMELIGRGHHSGKDGKIYDDLETMTTALNITQTITVREI